jgi:hypothetical protein
MAHGGAVALIDITHSPSIETEHLTDLSIDFEPVQVFTTPLGTRLTYVVERGIVDGPRLRGEVLPGSGDWIVVGSDRIARLDVRATIRTEDDQLVHLTNTGRVRLDDVAFERFYNGELLAWDEIYARSAPLFETGAEAYAWLNSAVTVAVNQVSLGHVDYRIFLVK